jgi:dephospho-CoA kinase
MYLLLYLIKINNMLKVGLTGNLYSGVDKIGYIFEEILVPVFDADTILKFIIQYNGKIIEGITEKYYDLDRLNIRKVADDGKMIKLLSSVEDDLFDAYYEFMRRNSKSVYVIFKSKFLMEMGWNNKLDLNCYTFAPELERFYKFIGDLDIKKGRAMNLMRKEMNPNIKMDLSNYIIQNKADYEYKTLVEQVEQIDNSLVDYFIYNEVTQ